MKSFIIKFYSIYGVEKKWFYVTSKNSAMNKFVSYMNENIDDCIEFISIKEIK